MSYSPLALASPANWTNVSFGRNVETLQWDSCLFVHSFVRNWVTRVTGVTRVTVSLGELCLPLLSRARYYDTPKRPAKRAQQHTVYRPRRYGSTGAPLWERQMSQNQIDKLLVKKLFLRYSVVSVLAQTLNEWLLIVSDKVCPAHRNI